MREKAQLIIDLLKDYFKYKNPDYYNALCTYNPDTDLIMSNEPEFWFMIKTNNFSLDIDPERILKAPCNKDIELVEVFHFFDIPDDSCTKKNNKNQNWDKVIDYFQSINGN